MEREEILEKLSNIHPDVLNYLLQKAQKELGEAEEVQKKAKIAELKNFVPGLKGFKEDISLEELDRILSFLKKAEYEPVKINNLNEDSKFKIALGRGWLIILGLGIAALLFYLLRITFLG